MARLPDSAVELIDSGVHAHLATINPDGLPQLSMVWSAIEDGEICVACLTPRQKLKNIERDPRVVVSYQSPELDPAGLLHHYLVVVGRAHITAGGAEAFLRRIAPRFVGDRKFPRGDDNPPGWIIHIEPVRWRGYGPWAP